METICKLVIVPLNLTHKVQPLDLTINQKAKRFVSNQFNKLYAERVSRQLTNGKLPGDIKVSLKLNDLKPLYAKWVVEIHEYLKEQRIKGFVKARIMIFTKIFTQDARAFFTIGVENKRLIID